MYNLHIFMNKLQYLHYVILLVGHFKIPLQQPLIIWQGNIHKGPPLPLSAGLPLRMAPYVPIADIVA